MKKLSLKKLNLGANELLKREQLKTVLGGMVALIVRTNVEKTRIVTEETKIHAISVAQYLERLVKDA